MAQKLWEKNVQVDQEVDTFTVGKDREMDLYLAKYDVLGSMAHITMLESIGLLTKKELEVLLRELKAILQDCRRESIRHRKGRRGCPFASGVDAYPPAGRHRKENTQRAFAQRPKYCWI